MMSPLLSDEVRRLSDSLGTWALPSTCNSQGFIDGNPWFIPCLQEHLPESSFAFSEDPHIGDLF